MPNKNSENTGKSYSKYYLLLGTFEVTSASNPKETSKKGYKDPSAYTSNQQFKWKKIEEYDDFDDAYKGYKSYVNKQLSYTDEELTKIWKSGRLDVELKKDDKLLNWTGIFVREASDEDEDTDTKKDSATYTIGDAFAILNDAEEHREFDDKIAESMRETFFNRLTTNWRAKNSYRFKEEDIRDISYEISDDKQEIRFVVDIEIPLRGQDFSHWTEKLGNYYRQASQSALDRLFINSHVNYNGLHGRYIQQVKRSVSDVENVKDANGDSFLSMTCKTTYRIGSSLQEVKKGQIKHFSNEERARFEQEIEELKNEYLFERKQDYGAMEMEARREYDRTHSDESYKKYLEFRNKRINREHNLQNIQSAILNLKHKLEQDIDESSMVDSVEMNDDYVDDIKKEQEHLKELKKQMQELRERVLHTRDFSDNTKKKFIEAKNKLDKQIKESEAKIAELHKNESDPIPEMKLNIIKKETPSEVVKRLKTQEEQAKESKERSKRKRLERARGKIAKEIEKSTRGEIEESEEDEEGEKKYTLKTGAYSGWYPIVDNKIEGTNIKVLSESEVNEIDNSIDELNKKIKKTQEDREKIVELENYKINCLNFAKELDKFYDGNKDYPKQKLKVALTVNREYESFGEEIIKPVQNEETNEEKYVEAFKNAKRFKYPTYDFEIVPVESNLSNKNTEEGNKRERFVAKLQNILNSTAIGVNKDGRIVINKNLLNNKENIKKLIKSKIVIGEPKSYSGEDFKAKRLKINPYFFADPLGHADLDKLQSPAESSLSRLKNAASRKEMANLLEEYNKQLDWNFLYSLYKHYGAKMYRNPNQEEVARLNSIQDLIAYYLDNFDDKTHRLKKSK